MLAARNSTPTTSLRRGSEQRRVKTCRFAGFFVHYPPARFAALSSKNVGRNDKTPAGKALPGQRSKSFRQVVFDSIVFVVRSFAKVAKHPKICNKLNDFARNTATKPRENCNAICPKNRTTP